MMNCLSHSMLLIPSASGLVTKTQYDLDKQGLEKKIEGADTRIRNTSGLIKMTDYNTKITQIEIKTPSVTGLVTITMFNTKATENENKKSDITNLSIRVALNTKSAEVESKIPDAANFLTKAKANCIIKNADPNQEEIDKLKKS